MFLSGRMRLFPLSLAGCAAVLLAPGAALADGIYKYVEKDGTIVYTNVPPSGKKAHRLRRMPRSPRRRSRKVWDSTTR